MITSRVSSIKVLPNTCCLMELDGQLRAIAELPKFTIGQEMTTHCFYLMSENVLSFDVLDVLMKVVLICVLVLSEPSP